MTHTDVLLSLAPFGTLAVIIPLLTSQSRRIGQLEGRIARLEEKLDVMLEIWGKRR